jgi:peptide/nickel transport system permease protein
MNDSLERTVTSAPGQSDDPDRWGMPDGSEESPVRHRFRRIDTTYRLLRHPSGVLGLFLLSVVGAAVLLAPLIARYNPDSINADTLNLLPTGAHPFGTDYLGRDLLARTLYGGRLSLAVGFGVVAIESTFGVAFGLLAGFAGRVVDSTIMRLMDVLLAIPGLLLALGIIAVLGRGLESAVIALGVGGIPFYARLTRGMTLKIQEQEYVLAARASGFSRFRTLRRHILPNVLDPLIVMITTGFGGAILAASALSYLGIGAQPPDADWGSLLFSGYDHMFEAWSELLFPGIVVCVTVLGATLLGDGLTDARNPRL